MRRPGFHRLVRSATLAVAVLVPASGALAQVLPASNPPDIVRLGTVSGNTPGTFQTFSFTYTPTISGSNWVGLAFRQDPAFWTVDSISLTLAGGANLLTNGGLSTGGAVSGFAIQAPQN